MLSLFQTPAGAAHWPSILSVLGWLVGSGVTGAFIFMNLRVNRGDRWRAFESAKTQEEKIAAAHKRVLASEQELAVLKERQKWREVTPEQSATIVAALKGAPRGVIGVSWVDVAEDGAAYAGQLLEVLKTVGGYTLPDRASSLAVFFSGPPLEGLILETNRRDNAVAGALQHALDRAGIDAPAILREGQSQDVYIKVFRKKRL